MYSLIGVAFHYCDTMYGFLLWTTINLKDLAGVFFDLWRPCMSGHDLYYRDRFPTLITALKVGQIFLCR